VSSLVVLHIDLYEFATKFSFVGLIVAGQENTFLLGFEFQRP
jgi:hypothetical protein